MDSNKIPAHHLRTLSAINRCRTAQLGGHIDKCDNCDHLRISYNSCRNRHCPKCQAVNKEVWIIQQEDMLLPVAYYHVVLTLPHEFNTLCMYNPRAMYDLLFEAAWHTLNTLANDPKWIGARTAATMILHTWSQTLQLHPHLHCIVPNGGLTQNGQWQFPKKGSNNFLFPVAAMKKIFKGFFMQALRAKIKKKALTIPSDYFTNYGGKNQWRRRLYNKQWVVFTKKPFSKSTHVIDYLGRYSHRVAITNGRILSRDNESVSFRYKDYRKGGESKIMKIKGTEFIRRFCLHILPSHYRKIRQYGLVSNACKRQAIKAARKALGVKNTQLLNRAERKALALMRLAGTTEMDLCPCCKTGKMKTIFGINKNKPPPDYLLNKIKKQKKNT